MRFSELRSRLKGRRPPKIALVASDDVTALQALSHTCENGMASAVLIGEPGLTYAAADSAGVSLSGMRLIAATTPQECVQQAIKLARLGHVHLIMKGHLPTPILMKTMLDRQLGFNRNGLLSHLAAFEIPSYHKLLFLTDTGMILNPNLDEKARILNNAVAFLRELGIKKPNVAILSATEKPNDKMPSSVDAAALTAMAANGDFGDVQVCGPIDVAIAMDPEAAKIKGVDCPIAGDADLWLTPDMVGGNILGKSLIYFAGAEAGGVIIGGHCPIILLSRSSSASDKENSILLGLSAHVDAAGQAGGGR